MSDDAAVFAAAPAKVNLYLHVTGRRADGYHLVDSLIAFAETADRLAVEPASDGSLSLASDGPFAGTLPSPADNLVLRAAERLRTAAGIGAGARLHLTKALPVASGIGGGSADAAAALRALARLWRLDPADPAPMAVAHTLGADVPVCLDGRTSRVAGIGADFVDHPALPPVPLVLANPGVAVPTAAVFRGLSACDDRTPALDVATTGWESVPDSTALARLLAATRNDLEPPARSLAPVIGDVLDALRAAPGSLIARMSGSGATCFALFANDTAAQAAAAELAAARPGWWVIGTRLRSAPPPVTVGSPPR
jgi:4-diphosphocytidyl-2-C-methyl-D-erythritol kinase